MCFVLICQLSKAKCQKNIHPAKIRFSARFPRSPMKKSRFSKPTTSLEAMELKQKPRKKSEKLKITAKRVTLLPGFLSNGFKSETVHKAPISRKSSGAPRIANNAPIPDEEPPGFETIPSGRAPIVRRSDRLSKKQEAAPRNYCLQVIASKSIFKEIKEKYARKLEKNPRNCDFGQRFLAQFKPSFIHEHSGYYQEKIFEEVTIVNDILSGKVQPVEMSLNRKRQFSEEEKENYPIKFPYVPQSKWVFQTPPNRKLNFTNTRVEDNNMRPAILENCNNETKKVYEVNKKINVDFSNYTNHQEINIDKRYMVEVANLPNSTDDITFQLHENDDKKFQFTSDPYELENHFLSLTCRPKKPMTVSRLHNNLKRKRDIFEPEAGCSNDSETATEFNSSFNFLNNNFEESFTFKFTSNEGTSGATTGHLFDFDGNKKDTFNFRF